MNTPSSSSPTPASLMSGLGSDAIDEESDVDANVILDDGARDGSRSDGASSSNLAGSSALRGFFSPETVQPAATSRRRSARMANAARLVESATAMRENDTANGDSTKDETSASFDAPKSEPIPPSTAKVAGAIDAIDESLDEAATVLMTSSRQRFVRLFEQAQARPQIAIGVVAAAGIVVTTLVWNRFGRLMLVAAGGIVAERMYGKTIAKTFKRTMKRVSKSKLLSR